MLKIFRSTFLVLVALCTLDGRSASAQEADASVATVFLADGTRIPLVEWNLSYEFLTWKQGENVTTAKPTTQRAASMVLGKKEIPVKGVTLGVNHSDIGGVARVVEFVVDGKNLKMEAPDRSILAPTLDKKVFYQPRSFDISGKTLSGTDRSFCIASLHALVDCGVSQSTRVVKVEFR